MSERVLSAVGPQRYSKSVEEKVVAVRPTAIDPLVLDAHQTPELGDEEILQPKRHRVPQQHVREIGVPVPSPRASGPFAAGARRHAGNVIEQRDDVAHTHIDGVHRCMVRW